MVGLDGVGAIDPAAEPPDLDRLIGIDQCQAVMRDLRRLVPANLSIGAAIALFGIHYGALATWLLWYAMAIVVALLRMRLCRKRSLDGCDGRQIATLLRSTCLLSLASGMLWALIPVFYIALPPAAHLFYLILLSGVTAIVVVNGGRYARAPLCFITPTLLSAGICLLLLGGLEHDALAAAVLFYWVAVARSVMATEAEFRLTSRLKHVAASSNLQAMGVARALHHHAIHDELTGLLNRHGFLASVDRHGDDGSTCLMMLDLDNFRSVNDMFGQRVGDRVLVAVAVRLRETLADHPLLGRLGGDEFAVLYRPGDTGIPPEAMAARLAEAMARPLHLEAAATVRTSASIGLHLPDGLGSEARLAAALAALHAAKAAGPGSVCLYDQALREQIEMRRDIERDLGRALFDAELEVWFQPIMAGSGATLSSFEALLRWNHPRHGWVSPDLVVRAAASAGLSLPLLRFVLDRACTALDRLRAEGHPQLWVSVNVSPREMAHLPVDQLVPAILSARGVSPGMLEIEITEETVMDLPAVQDKVAALAGAGVRLAIDDFGVGYSGLATLRRLQVDRIKIDRCFVTDLNDAGPDQILVQSIVGLGRSLGIDVVAEGVETREVAEQLQSYGCPSMQGFLFARPMPLCDVVIWLRRRILPAAQAFADQAGGIAAAGPRPGSVRDQTE